ncbi:RNA polymerase sigma-70 factor (ECF subfamily) [Salinibacterium sp. CAN_S4]|uniref:RNA polymerase sigma factor n=1 Tax=Salinibacterium sp. CAN_S4 TaxID=2787727 RepID=UPI0018F000FA
MTDPTVSEATIVSLAREESGRVIALLAHRFGDLDLADESVQDALLEALESWPINGIPSNPPAWLYTVARNKAIDRLRRAASARRRMLDSAHELTAEPWQEEPDMIVENSFVGDEQLRLLLLCCHPALDRNTQVALTLRLVGGLTTPEIAAAFLVPEATLAQRIVRAKRKIRDAGIPLNIPAHLDERVDALLDVLYLIFNEGYLSRGSGDSAIRVDLMDEAVRLTEQATELLPPNPEVLGLLAVELFGQSRVSTRLDRDGELILLDSQDRSRWDSESIARANRVLVSALAAMRPGPFQVQAMIAAHHANARTAADTDWSAIAALYSQLSAMTHSPIVEVNRAVAVAMADGPLAGLAVLDAVEGLDGYYLLHSTRGELLLRSLDHPAAVEAFRRARTLATNRAEKRHLDRRISETSQNNSRDLSI